MFVAAIVLTILMAGALLVVSAVAPAALRGPGPAKGGDPDRELDLYDAAFLSDGPARVVNVALLRMHESGVAHISSTGEVTLTGAESDLDDVQAAILGHARTSSGTVRVDELREHVKRTPAVQRIGDRLAADGLLLPAEHQPREVLKTALGIIFFIGIPAAVVAIVAFPSPTGWLIAVASGAAILLPYLGITVQRLSTAGRARLKEMRKRNPWADIPDSVLLGAVALGGLAVIESELLREAMTQQQAHAATTSAAPGVWCSSDAGADSGGGGDGGGGGGCGSGCGGGGCGGCGG